VALKPTPCVAVLPLSMDVHVEVDSLAELGEQDFIDEMVELFAVTVAATLVEGRDALSHADAHALARSAHKLKGACLGMFATTMAEMACALEQAGNSQNLDGASELFSRLELATAETTRQMRTVRSQVPTD
jgi:HPt (histidine-containing phosphotransfer) domain-containing protein